MAIAGTAGTSVAAGVLAIKVTGASAADVGRPITGTCGGKALGKKGWPVHITKYTSGTTTIGISVPTQAACPVGTKLKIEQTRSRTLLAGSGSGGYATGTIAAASPIVTCGLDSLTISGTAVTKSLVAPFTSADIGKSVTGAPWKPGARITATTATTATVELADGSDGANAGGCANSGNGVPATNPDYITIGGQTYASPSAAAASWDSDPMHLQLTNRSGSTAFTCAGTTTMTLDAGTVGQIPVLSGGTASDWVGLPVVIKKGTTTVNTKITEASGSEIKLANACPASPNSATIGVANRNAPGANATAFALGAVLNLSNDLVYTADNCSALTYEAFQVYGTWKTPGAFTATTATATVYGSPDVSAPRAATAQILIPTAVLSFVGYIAPYRTGGINPAGSHFEFSFPSLPTSATLCGGVGEGATALQFSFFPGYLASVNLVGTGEGNPSDPGMRGLNGSTGLFAGTYSIAGTVPGSGSLSGCTIPASTTAPSFNCS